MQEQGFDSLVVRFRDSVSCEENKPDFKELDLGSPVSPLKIRGVVNPGGGGAATSSCSSSLSGSVSGRPSTAKTQMTIWLTRETSRI